MALICLGSGVVSPPVSLLHSQVQLQLQLHWQTVSHLHALCLHGLQKRPINNTSHKELVCFILCGVIKRCALIIPQRLGRKADNLFNKGIIASLQFLTHLANEFGHGPGISIVNIMADFIRKVLFKR